MTGADKPILPPLEHLPAEDAPTPALKGIEAIRDAWKRLPAKPGVYRMIGADGEVLYVGKAKSLKNRVGQYAQGRGHTNAIYRMIHQTASMEVIVTATETEALLLETNMIKRLRPRYNVLMRDDKSFPFIAIRTDHPTPALQKHRGAKSFKGKFYGPFASAGAVNRTLNTLQKAFLLRSCSDSTFSGRTRPCMLYQIKRCSAPCVDLVSEGEYAALVKDSVDFLEGRSVELQDRLAVEMREAAEKLGVRARGAACAIASARWRQRARLAGHQPAHIQRSRRVRAALRRRAIVRAGVLLPRRPELGQPRLFPAPRRGGNRRRHPRRPSSRNSTTTANRRSSSSCNVEPTRPRIAGRSAYACARSARSKSAARARREERDRRRGAAQCARSAGPAHGRNRQRREIARRRRRSVRPSATARADRGLRQLPHPGHERAGRA